MLRLMQRAAGMFHQRLKPARATRRSLCSTPIGTVISGHSTSRGPWRYDRRHTSSPRACRIAEHMREAVIVASSRTPLAKSHRGSFNMTRPDDLAAHCIADVLRKTPRLNAAEIEEVILGCGQPHGPQGHNIARVAGLPAGLPVSVPGVTVNRFCNYGLQAIVQAAHMVMQEGVEAAIGGGVESITMMQRDTSPNPWVLDR